MSQYKIKTVEVTISECVDFIYITMSSALQDSLPWEQIQDIKDSRYPDLVFVEVYPRRKDVINKANVRHLFHIKGGETPDLAMIERNDLETTFLQINYH